MPPATYFAAPADPPQKTPSRISTVATAVLPPRFLLYIAIIVTMIALGAVRPLVRLHEGIDVYNCIGSTTGDGCRPSVLSPAILERVTALCTTVIAPDAVPVEIHDTIITSPVRRQQIRERSIVCLSGGERYLLRMNAGTGCLRAINRLVPWPSDSFDPTAPMLSQSVAIQRTLQCLQLAGVAPAHVTRIVTCLDPPSEHNAREWIIIYRSTQSPHRDIRIKIALDGATGRIDSYWNPNELR